MPDRPKLEIVDDPVTGLARTPSPPAPPSAPSAPPNVAASAEPGGPGNDDSQHERQPQPEDPRTGGRPRCSAPSDPGEWVRAADPARSYGQEAKRAVFGRVPRSLSRRLERAVFELRDEFEDLTQEQVLAALLYEHVDAADPAALARLTDTVRRYRRELERQ
jgi:hypothetical protein